MKNRPHIAIIGGGAAGFFGAINLAQKLKEQNKKASIAIYESSSHYLKKVRISGGGRCNVTHNQFDIQSFVQNYPRGSRELISPMQRFQAKDTLEWFAKEGVKIIPEADGRMFPDTNSSDTIINTYLRLVEKYSIQCLPNHGLKAIMKKKDNTFELSMRNEKIILADFVLIATGSSLGGYKLAESLGHQITERAPSLFSFKIVDPLIKDLPGLSFETSLKLQLPNKKTFRQEGPSLITHWGLSGPAILKLSAWAAREMKQANYKASLTVNWVRNHSEQDVQGQLQHLKQNESRSLLKNTYPQLLPKRFWLSLLEKLNIDTGKQWANLKKKEINQITQALTASVFQIEGQNRFKDEFVECGGVSLREINFKSMESKICPGLYFAGEILDVDGITGGFNFQNAWTTSWTAAQDMASKI